MHTEIQSQQFQSSSESAAEVLLRTARHLHRSAFSDSLSIALPVLRRLLATSTLTAVSLVELQRNRDIIQRKHVLRMLAIEAGFNSWEDFRHALDRMSVDEINHYDPLRGAVGYPNLWFSNYEEAQAYANEHNCRPLRFGMQALVIRN